jgi:hypothetical protein
LRDEHHYTQTGQEGNRDRDRQEGADYELAVQLSEEFNRSALPPVQQPPRCQQPVRPRFPLRPEEQDPYDLLAPRTTFHSCHSDDITHNEPIRCTVCGHRYYADQFPPVPPSQWHAIHSRYEESIHSGALTPSQEEEWRRSQRRTRQRSPRRSPMASEDGSRPTRKKGKKDEKH